MNMALNLVSFDHIYLKLVTNSCLDDDYAKGLLSFILSSARFMNSKFY